MLPFISFGLLLCSARCQAAVDKIFELLDGVKRGRHGFFHVTHTYFYIQLTDLALHLPDELEQVPDHVDGGSGSDDAGSGNTGSDNAELDAFRAFLTRRLYLLNEDLIGYYYRFVCARPVSGGLLTCSCLGYLQPAPPIRARAHTHTHTHTHTHAHTHTTTISISISTTTTSSCATLPVTVCPVLFCCFINAPAVFSRSTHSLRRSDELVFNDPQSMEEFVLPDKKPLPSVIDFNIGRSG